ncbi:transmembrane emp24 domain-containing protein [Sphaerulina musiva SO2202]|uniref:Transmembrane emp24 domain-containing protein n=1 Tax=Sphaerulina musiva (strain SO2202) TaxID=692275 RepID=M3CWE0_SPHMS|nr:transmembrane emp24 domain-containing protein [Sphaerulina musiva SO2202]EMF08437.1 transmembrane emp24 domain-containing protein [Sphaerulina musiva SO2202]
MRSIFSSLALFMSCAEALYFFIEGPTQKCFFEELPKDTLVVGHYKATQYRPNSMQYETVPDMGVFISVDEVFDNEHRIVSQRGRSDGKFTFTAADSGQHRLCFTPTNLDKVNAPDRHGEHVGAVKFELDMAIGETSQIERSDKEKLGEVAQKVKDLNARLQDVRREQIFQREREAEFRDQSENVNSRVVRWTLVQIAVLGVTCAWQLSYLRAFFIKQKLT